MKIISSVLKGDWEGVKTAISNIINAIKNYLSTTWDAIKSALSSVMNAIKNVVSGVWDRIGTSVMNVVNKVKSFLSSAWDGIKTTATKAWNDLPDTITKPITKARDTIKGIIDKIKGFFSGVKLEFPAIKLPHFSVKPDGWKIGDLLKGSIPSLGIDWYAKAMDNPIVMTKPTIWGYDPETGNLRGGGEAGTEVVSGANTLMNMIQGAVAAQNDTLVYYLQMLIEMLAEYFPESLEAMKRKSTFNPDEAARALAYPMNRELGRIAAMEGRGR